MLRAIESRMNLLRLSVLNRENTKNLEFHEIIESWISLILFGFHGEIYL